MNGLCRMADVSMGANKEKLNALKTKGMDTILTTVSITTDGCEGLESVAGYGSDIMSIGLKWCIKLDMEGLKAKAAALSIEDAAARSGK